MQLDCSIQLLQGLYDGDLEPKDAEDIAARCRGVPLLLVVVGNMLWRGDVKPADVIRLLPAAPLKLLGEALSATIQVCYAVGWPAQSTHSVVSSHRPKGRTGSRLLASLVSRWIMWHSKARNR
jgi:hypothetical protein